MVSLLALVTLVVLQEAPAAPRPVTAPLPTTGTAIVRGQVTDKETGAAIPRAVVTLRLTGPGRNIARQHLTDQEGRFEFTAVPAGPYEVVANAGEHRSTHLRQTFRSIGSSAPTLSEGEVRENVNFALARAFVISGRVTDELGDPLAGVGVRLHSLSEDSGQYIQPRATDDRGLYRVFGVAPGRYTVCVEVRNDLAGMNASRQSQHFINTCYPSATTDSEAQPVHVAAHDVTGIDIAVRKLRTFTISGVVVDAAGAPAGDVDVTFHRYRQDGGTGSTRRSADGQFRFEGLTPGDYAVEARKGIRTLGMVMDAPDERGYAAVKIDQDDVEFVLAMRKPATVRGRVVFEDGAPPVQGSDPITIGTEFEGPHGGWPVRPAPIDADGSFTLTGLMDPVRLLVQNLPRGWIVKSVRYRGQDITDAPTEFATDPSREIDIVLTSRVAVVTGTVTDDTGKPPARARVFLLPADPRLAGRRLFRYGGGFVRPADGWFAMYSVRAGDYVIVAIAVEQAEMLDRQRATVGTLVKYGERISVVENDRMTMNLRLVTLPDVR